MNGPPFHATDPFDRETIKPFQRHFVNFPTTTTAVPCHHVTRSTMDAPVRGAPRPR